MRAGIRQALKDNIVELKDCYEPNVPNKDTIKPYGVIVQGSDDSDTTGFKRTIEIWLYEKRTTFQNLDKLAQNVIDTLNLNTITDNNTKESYTCLYEGAIGQDVIDEEWNAIARGLRFSVIAVYESKSNTTTDKWIESVCKYTEELTQIPSYRSYWKKNFNVPSTLWRVTNVSKQKVNHYMHKVTKTLKCHVVSRDKNQIETYLDLIESSLVEDLKIALDISDRRYLTIESIVEDRTSDMLGAGQLTVTFSRMDKITINPEDTQVINKIYDSGYIK